MKHHAPTRALVGAFLAALLLAGLARADRLDFSIPPGATTPVSISGKGDVQVIGVLLSASDTTKVAVKAKIAKKSALGLDVKLFRPDGSLFDPQSVGGKVKAKPSSYSATFTGVQQQGLWRVEVRGADDSEGDCTLSVKAKESSKKAGSIIIPAGGSTEVPIQAGTTSELTLKVKRAGGSTVTPVLRLFDPNGLLVDMGDLVQTNERSGQATLKKFRLPVFGAYRLRISGDAGRGGSVSYSAILKQAKIVSGGPVADPGPGFEVEPGLVATLSAAASQVGPGASFLWTQIGGEPVQLSDPRSPTPTFTAPETGGSMAFELVVAQGGLISPGAQVAVEVARRPLADAGRSQQVATGEQVTLDGRGSIDRGGAGITWRWTQDPADPVQVTLDDPSSSTPTFQAPGTDAVMHFSLVVDDGRARSFEDEVVVVAGTPRPLADAGRQQIVRRMASVYLSALASRRPGATLDNGISWQQVSGPPVEFDRQNGFATSFTAPRESADLKFRVTVDGDPATADEVSVHVRKLETNIAGRALVANAVMTASGDVGLSASGSFDPETDPLAFQWAQVAGPAVSLSNPQSPVATASIPSDDALRQFAVQTNDGLAYGCVDLVTVARAGYQGLPLANGGGDVVVTPGVPVSLDGRASQRTDGGVDPVEYCWTQVSGTDWYDVAASQPGWDPFAAQPTFTLPVEVSSLTPTRTLIFQLSVDDGMGTSLVDYATVQFNGLPLNGKPIVTAQVSDDNPIVGAVVTLSATATDLDGDPLTLSWRQTMGTTVTLSPNPSALVTTFAAPASGTLHFDFSADDGFDVTTSQTLVVLVDAKPTAAISVTPLNGSPGTQVTMDGRGSADPEGNPLTYQWTQISGPAVSVNLTDPAFQFTAPAQPVAFSLVVHDGRQGSTAATAQFSSAPPPDVNPTASATSAPYGQSGVTLFANPSGTTTGITFEWRQVPSGSDPTVSLSSTTAQNPTFTVPVPTTTRFGSSPGATFGVKASNGVITSQEKTVRVTFYASLNDTNKTSNTVYGIINSNCTSCHFGSSNPCSGGQSQYGMGTISAFLSNSVSVGACASTKTRIAAGNINGSYFIDRLKGIGGAVMPTGGSLPSASILLIEDWVDQGALNN